MTAAIRGIRSRFEIDIYIDELKADLAIARLKLAALRKAAGPERHRLKLEMTGAMNSIQDALKTGPTYRDDGGPGSPGSD